MSEDNKNKDEGEGTSYEGRGTKKEGMNVPENYFDSFSSRLFSKIKANDELKDFPLLSGLEKVNPFSVPVGYFEAKEELLQFAVLRDLKQKNFIVPANYFETLPARLANKMAVAEETKEYAALAAVTKENVFAVPTAYFDEFAGHVKQVVSPARIVPLYGRILKKYSFAVAAAILLLLTFTVILINQKTEIQPSNECNTFACLSKKDIITSNYLMNASEESIIDMIDEDALSDSLFLKKDGKQEKISAEEISNEIDVNTLTEEL